MPIEERIPELFHRYADKYAEEHAHYEDDYGAPYEILDRPEKISVRRSCRTEDAKILEKDCHFC